MGKLGKIARGAAFGFTLLKRYVSNRCIEGRWQFAGWSNGFVMEVLMAQGV